MALRVLHCPFGVAGNAPALARAERELGLHSVSVTLEGWGVNRELQRWRLLRRALREFDVVHFNFGSTLLARYWPSVHRGVRAPIGWYARAVELRDLAWLKRAGKAVFVTFQGDDARQGDVWRERYEITHAKVVDYFNPADDLRKRRAIAGFDKWADGIYALNPDLLTTLPARAHFLPYANVDLRDWHPAPPPANDTPVVLHAPTDRVVKGTAAVVEAVHRLQDEGIAVELALVEGVPHTQARRLYARADVLVDQLRAGWYGGLAVELMALGRPSVAYIREEDLRSLPSEMRAELPVVNATEDTLVDVLRDLLTTRRSELPELGVRSRAYVERWHDPLAISRRLKADYERALGL